MTWLETTLDDIARLPDAAAVPALMRQIAQRYELTTVAYLATGFGTHRRGQDPYLAVTYSSDWIEHYRSRAYVKIDPTIQIGLRRLLPIDWDDLGAQDHMLERFFGEATEFGLGRKGMSFPVHGRGGDRALFSISADVSDRDWQWARRAALSQFPIIAAHLHNAVLRTEGVEKAQPHLSPRELECLQWTSEGKTVWECGLILGLSPHTVRCYMESARHKLGATSNTHAVSIALKAGILFDLP